MEQNNVRLCRNCGAPLYQADKFCTSCGSPVQQASVQQVSVQQDAYRQPVNQQNPYQQNSYQQNSYQQSSYQQPQVNYGTHDFNPAAAKGMTKKEYRKVCKNKKYLSQINSAAIFVYVSVGITVLMMVLTQSLWALIDIAITLPLAIVLQTKKSKGCAVGLLIYAIATVLINLIISGEFSGWLWLIAGIDAVTAFSVADKEYKSAQMYQ